MQVINYHDWPERTLSYLCRVFDNLKTGEKYSSARGAYHIGFLDYTLFPEAPNFYNQYTLREERTHHLFTSKFKISVVDLTLINQADDYDKQAHRDLWARFFKATRWEELHMLATQDKYINEAAQKLHHLVEDKRFRDQLWEREDYIRREKDRDDYFQGRIEALEQSNQEKDAVIADSKATIADMAAEIEALKAQLSRNS